MSSPSHAPDPTLEQSSQSLESAPSAPPKSRKGVFAIIGVFAIVAGAILAVFLYNQVKLQGPLDKVLAADDRNKNVNARAHFDHWIDSGTVVFNLSTVAGNSSQMDVFRVLLQFARSQKEQKYKQVILASYGENKFIVPGDYFQQLGAEYGSQNPVYTIRTFPHHVSNMSGEKPFPEYTGGILGVLGKEMDEFNDMNKQWFLNDYIARQK